MRSSWSRLALDDLEHAVDWISAGDPGAARGVATRIRDAVRAVETHPGLGRPGRVPSTREHVVASTPYILVYRQRDENIEILRILHARRRWPPRRR